MRKVKWGIIGLGWFGEKHCEALRRHPAGRALRAVHPDRVAAEGAGQEVRREEDLHRLQQDAGRSRAGRRQRRDHVGPARRPTLAALKAGKHVFLEKPMASTVADCRAIVDAAKATGKYFMVGHICRFNPRYAAAKGAIAAGKIGKIVSMYAPAQHPRLGRRLGAAQDRPDHRRRRPRHRPHAVVLRRQGRDRLRADRQRPRPQESRPRLDHVSLRHRRHRRARERVVPARHDGVPIDERMEIIGTEGSIHIHETHPNLRVVDRNGWHSPDTTYWPIRHGVAGARWRGAELLRHLRLNGPRPPSSRRRNRWPRWWPAWRRRSRLRPGRS